MYCTFTGTPIEVFGVEPEHLNQPSSRVLFVVLAACCTASTITHVAGELKSLNLFIWSVRFLWATTRNPGGREVSVLLFWRTWCSVATTRTYSSIFVLRTDNLSVVEPDANCSSALAPLPDATWLSFCVVYIICFCPSNTLAFRQDPQHHREQDTIQNAASRV